MCSCQKRMIFLLGVVGIALAASFFWQGKHHALSVTPAAVAESVAGKPVTATAVAVYYFHGSIRCEKCLEIERVSREIVLSFYADDLAAGRMKWESVNYELPENRHFFDDFNLGLPSLAVECRKGGSVRRTVLTNTWEKVEVQEDLEAYVINGIECFRNRQEGVPVPQAARP